MHHRCNSLPALLFGCAEVLAIVFLSRAASGGTAEGASGTSRASVHLRAQLDRSTMLEGGDGIVRVELTIGSAAHADSIDPTPTDLLILFDRSDSMKGEKIERAKEAVAALADALSPEDRMSFVSFAGQAELHWGLELTQQQVQNKIPSTMRELEARGATNPMAALDLALLQLAEPFDEARVQRVVMISDGWPSSGPGSYSAIERRARDTFELHAVLSTVAVGSDFEQDLLPRLADEGGGNFFYLADAEALDRILERELVDARRTVARQLEVGIDLGPGVRLEDAAGYPLLRDGHTVRFRLGDLHASRERRFWLTLRAPTYGAGELGEIALDYLVDGRPERIVLEIPWIRPVATRSEHLDSFDPEAWSRAVSTQELGSLQEAVGRELALGRLRRAVSAMAAFRASKTSPGGVIGSTVIEASALEGLEQVEFALENPRERGHLGRRLIDLGRLTKGR